MMNQSPQRIDNTKAMSRLVAVAKAINSNRDLTTVLTDIMRAAEELVEADAASLLVMEEATGDLCFHVALGDTGRELRQKRLPIGQGIAGWVAERREALNVTDVHADPRFAASFDRQTGYKTHTVLAVPLLCKDKLVGVLEAVNKLTGDAFTDNDERLLTLFAEHAAVAIETARLLEALRAANTTLEQTIAERTRDLVDANAQLTAVLQSIGEGLAIIDTDFRIQWINGAMRRWFGEAETMGKRTCYEAFHGRATPCENCPAVRTLKNGRTERTEEAVWTLEGAPRSCEVIASPIADENGEVARIVEAVRDVTEHKELELARVHEAQLQTLSEIVTSINHEINNPLTAILGNAELLRHQLPVANGKIAERLITIAESARRISDVTHKLSAVVQPVSCEYAGNLRMLDLEASLKKDQLGTHPNDES